MTVGQAVAIRLAALMEELGFSKEELAEKSGLSVKTIEKFLNHEYKRTRTDKIFLMCRAMDISLEDFFVDVHVDKNEPSC